MRAPLLLGILFLAACGQMEEKPKETIVGESRKFSPEALSPEALRALESVCDAVEENEIVALPRLTGAIFNFGYAESTCSSQALGPEQVVATVLTSDGTQWRFQTAWQGFPFVTVDTRNRGALADVCRAIANGEDAAYTSASKRTAVFFQAGVRDCSSDSSHQCLQVQHGTSSDGGQNFRIQSSEILRVRLSGLRSGFVVERRLATTGACENGAVLIRRAVLR